MLSCVVLINEVDTVQHGMFRTATSSLLNASPSRHVQLSIMLELRALFSDILHHFPPLPLLSSFFVILTQGPQLVQMYIGDGAKLVRDAFDLAKEKILKEGRKVHIV